MKPVMINFLTYKTTTNVHLAALMEYTLEYNTLEYNSMEYVFVNAFCLNF